jgi:hypothetical protein
MYHASRYALGITHWIATFEDSLFRLLKQYGIEFKLLIPDEIDYYGKVRLYGCSIVTRWINSRPVESASFPGSQLLDDCRIVRCLAADPS